MENMIASIKERESSEVVGYLLCEERGYTGGDADDVWFYYHKLCHGKFIESLPDYTYTLEGGITFQEAKDDLWICDWCDQLLIDTPGEKDE